MINHYIIQNRDGTSSVGQFHLLKKALVAAEREAKRTKEPWDVIAIGRNEDSILRFYTADGKGWKIQKLIG